jgi:PAS domain S-box-containing protein
MARKEEAELSMPAEKEYPIKIESLLKLHKRGLTISDISQKLNLNRNSVAKYLDNLVTSGRAERTGFGNTGVFYLSQRVPVSSLLNFSSEFVIVLNDQGRIIQVNECLLSFFGETRESLEGKTLDEAPVEMIRACKDLDLFKQPGIRRESATEMSTLLFGESYHFRVKVLPTLLEDGGHGFTILIENVTPQKRYEQELIRSEARYRAIVEDQTDLICRRLPDGTITFVNDAFCRYFGKKPDDLMGTVFSPVIASPGSGDVPGAPRATGRPFRTSTTEDRVILENGEIKWLQWKNRALHDKAGNIVEIQSVGRDITGQREREKEILLRDCAVARSSHPIALFDMIGRAIYLNSAFLSLFGYPDDREIIGHPVEQCFPRTDAHHNIHQFATALREQGHWEGVVQARKKDGTWFEAGFYGRLIGDDRYFPHCGLVLFTGHPRGIPSDPGKTVATATGGEGGVPVRNQTGPPGEVAGNLQERGSFTPAGTPGDPVPGGEAGYPEHYSSGQHPAPCSAGDSPEIPSLTFKELVDFIMHPTFIVDPEKNIIAWNRAMEIFTGIKKEEVIGSSGYGNAFSIYPGKRPMLIDLLDLPEDVRCREQPDVRRYGDTLFLERFIPGLKGTPGAYIYAKAAHLLDPDGRCIGAMETVNDITDWRNAQESLKKMRDEIDITFTGLIRQLEERIGSLDDCPER